MLFNYLSELRKGAEWIAVDTTVSSRVDARQPLQAQLQCTSLSGGDLGQSWWRVVQSPSPLNPPPLLMCHWRWDSWCFLSVHIDHCVCLQTNYIQSQPWFKCERGVTCLLSHHLSHTELEETQSLVPRLHNRAAVLQWGVTCWLTENECAGGEGQLRVLWAFNRKISGDQYQWL